MGPQPRMALTGDLRIGVRDGRDHPRDPRGDDGVGARWRLAVMGAGFERHIERRPAGAGTCARQGLDLGMGAPARLRPAAADDHRNVGRLIDHDGADGGIGPGIAEPAPAEREREVHEALVKPLVVRRECHRVASGPSAARAGAPKAPGERAPSARVCGIPAKKSTPPPRLQPGNERGAAPRGRPSTLRVSLQDQNGYQRTEARTIWSSVCTEPTPPRAGPTVTALTVAHPDAAVSPTHP